MNNRKSIWLFWLSVIGLSLLFVLLQWNSFNMPFERDEGEYAYSAWIMKEGHLPYVDTFLQKPPMIIYTYLASQILSADSVWPPRVLASLAAILTAILLGGIVQKLYGRRAGWLAMWMYLPMSMLPIFLPYAANTEKFLLLPLIFSLYLRFRRGSQAQWWEWMIAGTSAGVAVLYKQTAVVPLGISFIFWAVETWRSDRRAFPIVRNVLSAAVGAMAVTILVLAYFVYKGAFHDLIESTITFNYFYAEVGGRRLQFFSSMIVFLAKQWWVLIPLCGWYIYKPPARWLEEMTLFVATFFVASMDINGHYYLLMVPFLVIIISSALDSFLQWLPTKLRTASYVKWLLPAIPVAVIVVLLLPLRGIVGLNPERLSELVYWGNPFVESSVVAQRVRELTPKNEPIFVAGSEPQILFLAKRMSVTRFDIMYPLTMPTPFMKKYQDEVQEVLEKSPPEVVVFSLTQMSWFYQNTDYPGFRNYVELMLRTGAYSLVGGYMRNGPRKGWVEPLKGSEVTLCTLIVLKHTTPSR